MEETTTSTANTATETATQEADKPEPDPEEETNDNNSPNNGKQGHQQLSGKKRKRVSIDHYALAYENVSYEPIPPNPQDIQIPGVPETIHTTTPGTPLRQFAHSWRVSFRNDSSSTPNQILHQHANGLCIVTAGTDLPDSTTIETIEFRCRESGPCSAADRRKKNSKRLKKGTAQEHEGMVSPNTELVRLHFSNGTYQSLYALVWGTILELHTNITPQQLTQDPLLEGYLAVILPTGPFPPRQNGTNSTTPVVDENIKEE